MVVATDLVNQLAPGKYREMFVSSVTSQIFTFLH